MTPEQVLAEAPRVLSQGQRERYFAQGYLLVENAVPMDWIERLRAVTDAMVERSRHQTKSDEVFDLEPGHSAATPRLRRLSSPVIHHPLYWEFIATSPLGDIAADLLGPDVKFHHAKLNFKWAEGGEEVKWHQDITFWPHTNYGVLTIGTYLYDCGPEQGPLGVIPGSHEGPLFNQFNDHDEWVGCIAERDLAGIALDKADYLMGPAGSITIHHCRAVHGSRPNQSDTGRPLLLNTLSSADALPYTHNPLTTPYYGQCIRGRPARVAHHDPRPCPLPPDWSGGYSSIFALQQEEGIDAELLADRLRRAKQPASVM
ncbi:MAG TPA: phytanoyl-CoA dioxygenase family protein [Candidatus Sulfotelmatobacter sp.]|nr:phytanoyl-CoA dioxygenase family protein [Candidatus Sulfotelmatobacter sp.]